jgi:uncharacterized membrane protein HdeD (DUF308 family)
MMTEYTEYPVDPSGADTSAPDDAATARAAERPAVPFWQVIGLGVVTTLFGITVLTWPAETLRTLGVLVGIWLMVTGAARIVGAFLSKRGLGGQVLSGTVGVVLVIGGVACLRNVARGVLVLALIVALAWLLSGMAELVIAFQTTGASRTWLIVLAIVSIAIGLMFTFWPGLSLTTIVIMTGISGLVIGVGEIAFAFQMRRMAAMP